MTGKRARRADKAAGADSALTAGPDQAESSRQDRGRPGAGRRAAKRNQSTQSDTAQAGSAAPGSALAASSQAASSAAFSAQADASGAPRGAELNGAFLVPDDAVVRRTKDGWRVGSDELPDLTCAMILADLIAAESGMPDASSDKPTSEAIATETGRLRATVGQLEHALLTRIRVEQAIGVLAERHRIKPRQAFEQLRDAARSRGRKVIDIAGDVVASATNPLLQLPDELSRPRQGPRRAARQQFGAR
jgi:hypothetical protein